VLTLWRPLLLYGYSYKASCARPFIYNFWHPGTLTLRAERQSARMSKITNNGLTLSGTGCFIAVPIWQQWASKVEYVKYVVLFKFMLWMSCVYPVLYATHMSTDVNTLGPVELAAGWRLKLCGCGQAYSSTHQIQECICSRRLQQCSDIKDCRRLQYVTVSIPTWPSRSSYN